MRGDEISLSVGHVLSVTTHHWTAPETPYTPPHAKDLSRPPVKGSIRWQIMQAIQKMPAEFTEPEVRALLKCAKANSAPMVKRMHDAGLLECVGTRLADNGYDCKVYRLAVKS